MSHLLTAPLWRADSLGSPLPDNEFGISVSLPLWKHVIGYEEGDTAVTSTFQSGYPRFFMPPAISRLCDKVAADLGLATDQACLVFPRRIHAERCLLWLHRHDVGQGASVVEYGAESLGVAVFARTDYDQARKFWRFCGEVISIRQARFFLGLTQGEIPVPEIQGTAASSVIRQRLAGIAGQQADDVFLFPSGMAATFAVHRMLTAVFPGRKTVQLGFPYVDVLKVQELFGSGVHFFPVLNDEAYGALESLITAEPLAGIFSEAPTNPLLQCCDYERLQAMNPAGVPMIIDDTVGSSVHLDAFRAADVVTTSLTKAFSGSGDVLAGCVILNRQSRHYPAFASFLRDHADHGLFRADAVALEASSRDFVERAEVMSRNSVGLYEYLIKHPKVDRVWHSINEGGPGYRFLQRADGHGCLLSFTLKDPAATPAFYDELAVCKGPSLGTCFTLVCPYTLLAHYQELDWAESCGVPRFLIRVSVGLEPLGDLVARFERALG